MKIQIWSYTSASMKVLLKKCAIGLPDQARTSKDLLGQKMINLSISNGALSLKACNLNDTI